MTSGFSFLRSRRWIGIAALTAVIACVCTLLGIWQLQRHEYRAEAIAVVEANSSRPPVPLTELLTSTTTDVGADLEWRAVTVTGRYVGDPVALPQRGIGGQAADHALAMLEVDGPAGERWLLAVDRGWYPTDAFTDPGDRLATPPGEIELQLRLRPAEEPSPRQQVAGQVFTIAPSQVLTAATPDAGADPAGTLVETAYAWVVSETPTTTNPPTPLPVPDPNYRSNLSYALQWWAFALMAFIGYAVLARRERRALDEDDNNGDPAPAQAPPTRHRRRRTDAEIEDAEIDAARAQASETSSA